MKKNHTGAALVAPNAEGWSVRLPGGALQTAKTLDEAVLAIPTTERIHLALPSHAVLLERLTLPSTNREELAGMLQLQLEKTLPYPMDEISTDFEIIKQSETESTVLSVAANSSQLSLLCQPMRNRARLPQKITLYAMHIAAASPADQVTLSLWREEGQVAVAISEKGKLGFAHVFPSADAETLLADLPQLLLTAEMEGVPTEFATVRLEQSCVDLREPLARFFQCPVELVSFETGLPEPSGNLLPPAWQAEARRLERGALLKSRLQVAAVVYLLLVAIAFVFLAWKKSRVQKVTREVAELQPQLELTEARKARWQALAPAIDHTRYTVEVLHHLFTNLPSSEVRFTAFDHTPAQFMLEGEAPSANLAIDYVEKLKAEKALEHFRIESGPPSILPNGSAHFRIFGKL